MVVFTSTTRKELQSEFRQLMLSCHPDTGGENANVELTRKIIEEYRIVSNIIETEDYLPYVLNKAIAHLLTK